MTLFLFRKRYSGIHCPLRTHAGAVGYCVPLISTVFRYVFPTFGKSTGEWRFQYADLLPRECRFLSFCRKSGSVLLPVLLFRHRIVHFQVSYSSPPSDNYFMSAACHKADYSPLFSEPVSSALPSSELLSPDVLLSSDVLLSPELLLSSDVLLSEPVSSSVLSCST